MTNDNCETVRTKLEGKFVLIVALYLYTSVAEVDTWWPAHIIDRISNKSLKITSFKQINCLLYTHIFIFNLKWLYDYL